MGDFRLLLDLAHRHNIRLILDGVFNHCGRGFFAFADVLENHQHSPYRDWFHINRFPVDAFSPGEARDYKAWWGIKSLPKFNTTNPDVRKYLQSVARYWIEQGADGWRLDVPNEILMNYPFRECLLGMLTADGHDSSHCVASMESLTTIYPPENVNAMYVPLGSHDTERVLTRLHGDETRLRLAWLCQFAYPGAPAIYYGDEIGMLGGKDPECRGAFSWDESKWNKGLRDYLKKLISARKNLPALRRGAYRHLAAESHGQCLAFARLHGEQSVLVALNMGATHCRLSVPVGELGWQEGRSLRNLLDPGEYVVAGGALAIDLPPRAGAWIG